MKVYLGCIYAGYNGYDVEKVFLNHDKAKEWLKEKLKPYKNSPFSLNINYPKEGVDAWIDEREVIE